MDRPDDFVTIEKTENRTSRDGRTRGRFKQGDRIDRGTAHRFGLVDDGPALLARARDEQPDVAETDELDDPGPNENLAEAGTRTRNRRSTDQPAPTEG